MTTIPVITIDGPGGVGKGTMSCLLAKALAWNVLDSGALYRILALQARRAEIDFAESEALVNLAMSLAPKFELASQEGSYRVTLQGEEVTALIRSEECGADASKIAKQPAIRQALLPVQRAFRQAPGLVTDGRDMGTVVFPDATVKFFLQASVEIRAKRRQAQLKAQGIHATLDSLLDRLHKRDTRDISRAVSPLVRAPDAIAIDTGMLSIMEVLQVMREVIRKRIGV